ncbi:MAG TPA: TraM recognition domain-containing protein [Solirubrobacteraceae bacterium]
MPSLFALPLAGLALAIYLRWAGLRWTWSLAGTLLAWPVPPLAATCAVATLIGARWHRADLNDGGDLARRAAARRGPLDAARAQLSRRRPTVDDGGLAVGVDSHGAVVRLPLGRRSGTHTLVVGATGSGKTVTLAWTLARAIDAGHGAVIVDPKGDGLLREQALAGALRNGRRFFEWTPSGPTAYNPYGHGTDGEVADKALAAESYTEPHYLRQAQRYLGHAVRALRAAGQTPTPGRLVDLMDPKSLEVLSRRLPDEADARRIWDYLDTLDPRQRAGLSGARDRLAILAESELGRWLEGDDGGEPALDLLAAVRSRAVVYFRLDADRLPLLAGMLAAAIVGDLLTVAADLQAEPTPTVVVIDEFSAIAADGVARLFGRARSAGISLVLATQELADLRTAAPGLIDQVLGNLAGLVAHRQTVPDSAELIARVGGTAPVWTTTRTVEHNAPNGDGSRTRGREYIIDPDLIRTLPRGTAAVIDATSGRASVARIHHP